MTAAQLYIDGSSIAPDGGYYDVVDPSLEVIVGRAPDAGAGQAVAAAAAARSAWPAWAEVPVGERAVLVGRLAEAMLARHDLLELITAETGSTTRVAETQQYRYALGFLAKWSGVRAADFVTPLPPFAAPPAPGKPPQTTGAVSEHLPCGVVACITPFNYPLLTSCAMVGPALVAGNTVVLKPAPANPLTVLALAEAADEIGLPKGVLNLVSGRSPELGKALVDCDDVDMVSFTGSTAVGRQIAASAGRAMKRVLLELGGKGAAIVLEDADLETAAAGIATTWTRHSGQVCTAPTRVIAHRSVHARLRELLADIATSLVVGDPRHPDTVVGPLTTDRQRDVVLGYVASSEAEGAEPLRGKAPDAGRGFFVAPTLVVGCQPGMRIVREEVFGPVVAVLDPVDSDEQALSLANSSAFGLQDYIWSNDTVRALALARRLRTGYVDVNTTARSPDAPFGGFGASGLGRDGGMFSLHAYTEQQSILWAG